MTALLWTLVVVGGINTFSILYCYFVLGGLAPVTTASRFGDAIYTAVLMLWAFWLLARGA